MRWHGLQTQGFVRIAPMTTDEGERIMPSKSNCGTCAIRGKYEDNPRSFVGRLWGWHGEWCPGWRSYITSLPDEERRALAHKYHMKRYSH